MVICLELGADLHMAQLMLLPLTVSCFSKIQTGFTFLVPAHLGSPGKRAVKRACVCVCACISESDQGGFQQRQGWSTANCWSPSVSIDFAPRHRHAAAATVITANSRRTLVSLHIITMMHTTATDTTHIYTRRYNSHCTCKPFSAFSALTLFMGVRKSIRSVKIGYLSAARCRLFAYSPADATASQNPITSCFI